MLEALPTKLSEPASVALHKLVTAYTSELDALTQGSQKKRQMIQKCTSAFEKFRVAIRCTAPVFVPKTRDEANRVNYNVRASDDEDTEDEDISRNKSW